MKILEIGETHSLPPEYAGVGLRFRFDDSGTEDGVIAVPAAARALLARFEWHHLNRKMAQVILQERPEAVYVKGLSGCTLDLPRVARLLGLPVCLEVQQLPDSASLDSRTLIAVTSMLTYVDVLVTEERQNNIQTFGKTPLRVDTCEEAIAVLAKLNPRPATFMDRDYALYEFCLRDHPLLVEMQRQYLKHFQGCSSVLDLGCGAGIFLGMLADDGIPAMGVERSPLIAEYASGMGVVVENADALDFLCSDKRKFDGIYCSHFVEHLPFEVVSELLARMANALNPGGVMVLVFPDPESIRSQLFGFWRDPEHVRFYHPELIELLGVSSGLVCEWKSSNDQPHEIFPYPADTGFQTGTISWPDLPASLPKEVQTQWWWRLIGKLGLGPLSVSHRTRAELALLRQRCDALTDVLLSHGHALTDARKQVDSLWKINQTWAWQDNAALRFRKPLSE